MEQITSASYVSGIDLPNETGNAMSYKDEKRKPDLYESENVVKLDFQNINGTTIEDVQRLLEMQHQFDDFRKLMMEYECAISEVRTKLDVLNAEMSLRTDRNPFESIKVRLKSPISIYEKIERRGYPFTVESIRDNLHDIAGIRVVCSFIDDIYRLRDYLLQQDDVTLVEEKDYIANPKPNGYRSLHIIIEIPVFMVEGKVLRRVEVQFRTIAMDFWASLEHKLKYKRDIENAETIIEELAISADMVNQLDRRMQQIREKIDGNTIKEENM